MAVPRAKLPLTRQVTPLRVFGVWGLATAHSAHIYKFFWMIQRVLSRFESDAHAIGSAIMSCACNAHTRYHTVAWAQCLTMSGIEPFLRQNSNPLLP